MTTLNVTFLLAMTEICVHYVLTSWIVAFGTVCIVQDLSVLFSGLQRPQTQPPNSFLTFRPRLPGPQDTATVAKTKQGHKDASKSI